VKEAGAKVDWELGPRPRGRNCVGVLGLSRSFGNEASSSVFEITGKGLGMERPFYLKLEQVH
jgi:hypothetical protein